MEEIGSEFQWAGLDNGKGIVEIGECRDSAFVFSGRTALETILKNMKCVRKACLPSYCCDSMIQPFREQGIEVVFYEVSYDDGLSVKMRIAPDVEVLLWCNYFGFELEMPDLTEFISRGGIVIEDITHSLLSKQVFHYQSRYVAASLRKWFPILDGGYCADLKGTMHYKPELKPSDRYLALKKQAMKLKAEYLKTPSEPKKNEFMDLFHFCNSWVAQNYNNTMIDDESLYFLTKADIETYRRKRRANAEVLYSGLGHCESYRFMFPISKMDCPLFVPIIVNKDKREKILKKLIENKIYCPCHWPHPQADCESNLYDLELSLVCDQRYSPEDMERMASLLCRIEL